MSTPEQTDLMRFEQARSAHTENMKAYNGICADITRCGTERGGAVEAGKAAESNWRMRFRSLRGNLTDELRAEHTQRIASRELAEEFSGLLKELELDKQSAMLACCQSAKQYVEAHRSAFTEFADANWASALRNVSPSLLWAVRLRLQREQVAPAENDERDAIQVVAALLGEALTRAAAALPESVLKEAPVLENIGLHRPALTGVDMELFNSLAKRNRLGASIREARAKLQEENHK